MYLRSSLLRSDGNSASATQHPRGARPDGAVATNTTRRRRTVHLARLERVEDLGDEDGELLAEALRAAAAATAATATPTLARHIFRLDAALERVLCQG
jgi:hypothetical protein